MNDEFKERLARIEKKHQTEAPAPRQADVGQPADLAANRPVKRAGSRMTKLIIGTAFVFILPSTLALGAMFYAEFQNQDTQQFNGVDVVSVQTLDKRP